MFSFRSSRSWRPAAPQRAPIATAALLGCALLCLAGVNGALSRRALRRNRPQGDFIDVDGTNVHYVVRGKGPPLVILHGNGSNVADFLASDLVGQLAERHTVYLFDRPGYGHTDGGKGWWTAGQQARFLDKALTALNITGEIVLAHSWATLGALALAKIRPVAGLVLISGYYFPSARLDVIAAALPAAPVTGTIWRWTFGPLVARLLIRPIFRALFSPASVPARFKTMFPVDLALRPGSLKASASESLFMIPTAFSLASHYATVTTPMMVVAGVEDRIVDPSQSKRLRDAVPGAGLILVAGAGHMLHHTDPTEIVSAVQTLTDGPEKALESGPVPESLDPAP